MTMNRLEQRATLARTHDAAGEGESVHTRRARSFGFDPAVRRETPEPENDPAPLSPEVLRELYMTDEERDEAVAAREIEHERAIRADERARIARFLRTLFPEGVDATLSDERPLAHALTNLIEAGVRTLADLIESDALDSQAPQAPSATDQHRSQEPSEEP